MDMDKSQRRESGQTLVLIALVMTVLMLMVGLAIDVGMAYNVRRDMQNAADLAALAGAQRWCDNQGDQAYATAYEIAVVRNGADSDETVITSANYTVNVNAYADAQTFFFRVIGIESVPVRAEAEAICGCADAAGGQYPIAFDLNLWDDVGCIHDDGTLNDPNKPAAFMVWADDSIALPEGIGICELCDCDTYSGDAEGLDIHAYGSLTLSGGNRGWLTLGRPTEYSGCTGTGCGTGNEHTSCGLRYWITHGYQGAMGVGQCVPAGPGVTSGLKSIEQKDVTIVIYDPARDCTADMVVGAGDYDCPGDPLYIAEFGCVRIQVVDESFTLLNFDAKNQGDHCTFGSAPNEVKINNEKVLWVSRLCDCDPSAYGSAGPTLPFPGCVVAASLVK